MDKVCNQCGAPMKLIPAGISKKSGKPYQAFWSCTNRDCNATEKEVGAARAIPPKQSNPYEEVMQAKADSISRAQERKEDSIKISGAKRDAGLIVSAMIHAGELKGSDWKIKYKEIAEYIVNYNPEDITVDEVPF